MSHLLLLRSSTVVLGGAGVVIGGGSGSTFYVSPTGSDSNPGTHALPWKTIARVNAFAFAPGDTVLFQRGGTWYTSGIRIRAAGSVGLSPQVKKVAVGAYGDAATPLPIISAWKTLMPGSWVESSAGVWRIDVNSSITGNTFVTGAAGANIGRLLVDGDIKTIKCMSLGALANDWDYYSDNAQYLYVKSVANPGTRAAEIKASPSCSTGLIANDISTSWRDLRITGSGGHGANLAVSDTDIQWCWFDCLGGSVLANDHAQPRYGNGVESFASGSRHIVRNNLFTDCFDVALTAQGYPMTAASSGWTDLDFSDNWIARCAWGVEFWNSVSNPYVAGQNGPTGSGFNNVRARRLHLWDIGRGPSRLGRGTGAIWGVFVQTGDIQTPYQPLTVSVAEMHNCSDNLLFFSSPTGRRSTTDFAIEPSSLSLPAGSRIMRGYLQPTNTVEQWADFVTATSIGTGSTMTIESASQDLTPISTIYAAWQASK